MTEVIVWEDQERESIHWEMGIREGLSDESAQRRPGKMHKEIKRKRSTAWPWEWVTGSDSGLNSTGPKQKTKMKVKEQSGLSLLRVTESWTDWATFTLTVPLEQMADHSLTLKKIRNEFLEFRACVL